MSILSAYLAQRPEAAVFLLPGDFARTLEELFPRTESSLPEPIRIYPSDQTHPPILGFPVAESPVLKDLDAKLDKWLAEEVGWQVGRKPDSKEKAQLAFNAYLGTLSKVAENALMANVINDYHAIFWLAHSIDASRHFAALTRRVSARDSQTGRTQGDALKYRIYQRWAADTREMVNQLVAKAAPILDGEEQRALRFFRLLQDDVLIFTEEFIGPDLRELRSFVMGYLRRDFIGFKEAIEKVREAAADLLQRDRTFKAALPLLGVNPDHGISLALLLDARAQAFLFEQPAIQSAMKAEDREQFVLLAKRLREFAVLHQLRRGIVLMSVTADGAIVSADRRTGASFSRSTRPLDFGRQGVVDPMVHRFGLIYDISAFSETLGNLRRGGRKEEVHSYRQMLLFQRKLEAIASRHKLVFEKYLGDGAFYTTRRAMHLVRAAVEIQRFYSETRRKGFVFNKGLRIALNYGYYRLLQMKCGEDNERITEFYGPGIVELSRLTTGKATKEIDDLAAFLVAHGYNQAKVQQFFAPLAHGVDVVDHTQHAREFYAYLNANGHLINEGIVASVALLQELSNELLGNAQPLHRLRVPWGTYIGFAPGIAGLEWIGIRLLGMVSLKGLDNIEVGEIAPFLPGDAEATLIEGADSLVNAARQELHAREDRPAAILESLDTTTERLVEPELVICVANDPSEDQDDVLIGEWDPRSDDVHRPLHLPHGDFQRLFALKGALTAEVLAMRKKTVRELYHRLSDKTPAPAVPLGTYRDSYETFVLGEVVEKL